MTFDEGTEDEAWDEAWDETALPAMIVVLVVLAAFALFHFAGIAFLRIFGRA